MIPSLVAGELKTSLVEYLATTFALTDDAAYAALTEFLLDEQDGIFRGPYLRVRLPFVDAPAGSDLGVQWTPPGFQPYVHQLEAWRRLSSRGGTPRSTLVTTGTGSGKSEAFLIPILDHCLATRERGQRGIKALILYPMNALVTDQERRIAALLEDPALKAAGVTGGVWIGDDGTTKAAKAMGARHLIADQDALKADPPDILLTNYKMLDRLLLNESRQRLWAANTRPAEGGAEWVQPLQYVVLDEFHTYDGAQGTDVAMLLRRLGHRLGLATDASPLDGIACIGTSATLGTSRSARTNLREFAKKVFGQEFEPESVIGEQRRTVDEVCADLDVNASIPDPDDVAHLDPRDVDALAIAFTGEGFDDAQAVGDRLLRHPITASLLRIAAETPRTWSDVVAGLVAQIGPWRDAFAKNPGAVEVALERFVGLVSVARGRTADGGVRPLFAVELQVWVREVTRLRRMVSLEPGFRWSDSPGSPDQAAHQLPAVYCTACGRSGWMGVVNKAAGQGKAAIERLTLEDENDPYQVAVRERNRTRTMLRAAADEADVLFLDPVDSQVYNADSDGGTRIPVLVGGMTGDEHSADARDEAAQQQRCPSCGTRDAIRFLGSRVTTLASVGITQMFGSQAVADDERKLLAFTDSVQDASHRAAFFSGRTHRFNLRATLAAALQAKGRLALPEVAAVVLNRADNGADPAADIYALIPPDLLWERGLTAAWQQVGTPEADAARDELAKRISFDAVMEAGLRSRLGRTLESTGTAIAEVVVTEDEWDRIVSRSVESIQANAGQLLTDPAQVRVWAEGMVERLRQRGGIMHEFLDAYILENGKRYQIWGGAHPLAPKFPAGISAPSFFAASKSDEFDPISGKQSWTALWTRKVLGIEGAPADLIISDLLEFLREEGVVEARNDDKRRVWGIPAERVEFVAVEPDGERFPNTELRCTLCANRQYTTADRFDTWVGRPCMRLRCAGEYEAAAPRPTNYYRDLYRTGRIRRVVAAEHTGLLTRQQRERIENGFKDGGAPDAPNVLTATPTLEMGIDIGDLSAVMLTAVPPTQANYVQRVGRAGRKTGNAFVTTFAEADPRSLYFLHEPEQMIAGEIIPPNCYLDAIEILRRQYLAFLIDQAVRRGAGLFPDVGEMPRTIGKVAAEALQPEGWLVRLLDAGKAPGVHDQFIELFGTQLTPVTAESLARWITDDMQNHVKSRIDRWREDFKALRNQRDRLRDREKELKEKQNPDTEDLAALGRVVSELRYVATRISRAQNQDTLGAFEALGLLPNYTLFDDAVTLQVNLWKPNDAFDPDDEQSRRFASENTEYTRAATVAIRELAPGNYFYVNAHKVRIDAIDVGTENEPAHSQWRICPDCAWATTDVTAKLEACPRCGSSGAADKGAVLTVLPMRIVSSTESELSARVSDDTEDRDREWHEVVTTVDIDPADITEAYEHTSVAFGVEAARVAKIRYLNLGVHASRTGQAREIPIDGARRSASLFTVCRHCGGVLGVRGPWDDDTHPDHHRAWCKVRSKARKPLWDTLALSHELSTEAVRILLPIVDFEYLERVRSFKAALLLGLRDSFGGDPDHLQVIDGGFPSATNPDDRVRLVVIHDTTPGGTGYLPRLADPRRLQGILERARQLISTCTCQNRGLPGCHRCLYGQVARSEIPSISRTVALELLDEILKGWDLRPPKSGTITGVNLTKVKQSELERMFKVLLRRWGDAGGAQITSQPDVERPGYTRFDVRFPSGVHWVIREQQDLLAHGTVPDFFATRQDAPGSADVAIYVDGWEYHGADAEQIDLDAKRRASVRAGGTSVWTLTWNDVKAAMTAVNEGTSVGPGLPLTNPQRARARAAASGLLGADHACFGVLELGAFEQLMASLEHPDDAAWAALANGVAMALAEGREGMRVADIDDAADAIAVGASFEVVDHETERVVWEWTTSSAQRGATMLDRAEGLPRAVLSYDQTIDVERPRWTDWCHLGNMLQFLGPRAVITTTTLYVDEDAIVEPVATPVTAVPADARLDDVFDAAAQALARAAIGAGWTDFEVGLPAGDIDDTPIEVAWASQRVGILATGTPRPDTRVDWDLRDAATWTEADLLAALAGGEG